MSSPSPLSSKDAHVLSLLSLPTPIASQPTHSTYTSPTVTTAQAGFPPSLQEKEASILAPLNTASPSQSAIERAVNELTAVVKSQPTYASAYNNRAQAKRLLHGSDICSQSVHDAGIWTDLTTAIALSTPPTGGYVQKWQRKNLASAHTQRAWLVYTAAKGHEETGKDEKELLPEGLKELDREALEEWCWKEFELGGKYGNEVAKDMARGTNPYAKLCGAIVGGMLKEEMGGAASGKVGESTGVVND